MSVFEKLIQQAPYNETATNISLAKLLICATTHKEVRAALLRHEATQSVWALQTTSDDTLRAHI